MERPKEKPPTWPPNCYSGYDEGWNDACDYWEQWVEEEMEKERKHVDLEKQNSDLREKIQSLQDQLCDVQKELDEVRGI